MAKFIEVTDKAAPHITRYLNVDTILYVQPSPTGGTFIQSNHALEDIYLTAFEDYETVKELING